LRSDYTKLSEEEKAEFVKNKYDNLDGTQKYATSRDWNLRELEIGFILESLKDLKEGSQVLDIGCGNGYTDIRIVQSLPVYVEGIDFSEKMIEGANHLKVECKHMVGSVDFWIGDITSLDYKNDHFDAVVSERCLLNLPDRKTQFNVIREVHRVLKKGGVYIMVEGTRDGLRRLNELRTLMGLKPIPDKAKDNVNSLKFVEFELEEVLRYLPFRTVKKQYFGMYYLISRVVHPLLVAPNEPKFDAKINEVARKMAQVAPDYKRLGHIVGYVLKKL